MGRQSIELKKFNIKNKKFNIPAHYEASIQIKHTQNDILDVANRTSVQDKASEHNSNIKRNKLILS